MSNATEHPTVSQAQDKPDFRPTAEHQETSVPIGSGSVALLAGGTQGPTNPLAGLSRLDGTARTQLVTQLQRTQGNAYVQRMIRGMNNSIQRCACGGVAGVDGQCEKCRMEQTVHRAADPAGHHSAQPGSSSTTATLPALIASLEQAHKFHSQAGQTPDGTTGETEPEGHVHAQAVDRGLEQMRAVASGNDEALKLRVLAAFSRRRLEQAEQHVLAKAGPGTAVQVRENRPASVATKSRQNSHPQDAAEHEAERVADHFTSGNTPLIRQTTTDRVINRQVAEALMTAGGALLTADAEAGPVEAAAGPPGWAVAAVVGLAGLALLGTGMLMASHGNVADTGVMQQANALIASGQAPDICAALAMLMDATRRAGDTSQMQKIKATQKAKGCRHSRHS